MKISCIIVAGGRSERMGRDKKFLVINGRSMLEHVVQAVSELSDDIIVSVASESQAKKVKKLTNRKVVMDELKGLGPIAGLMAGLKSCKNEYALALPCDTPFIEPNVFKHMIKARGNYDAVIPRQGSFIEPLHAVYRVSSMVKACAETLEDNKTDIRSAISRLEKVNYMPFEVFRKYDERLLTFQNINTMKELKSILKQDNHGHTNQRFL